MITKPVLFLCAFLLISISGCSQGAERLPSAAELAIEANNNCPYFVDRDYMGLEETISIRSVVENESYYDDATGACMEVRYFPDMSVPGGMQYRYVVDYAPDVRIPRAFYVFEKGELDFVRFSYDDVIEVGGKNYTMNWCDGVTYILVQTAKFNATYDCVFKGRKVFENLTYVELDGKACEEYRPRCP